MAIKGVTHARSSNFYKKRVPEICTDARDQNCAVKGKGKGVCIAIYGNPSHNDGVSLAVWAHTVLPSARHKRTHPAFTPYCLASALTVLDLPTI